MHESSVNFKPLDILRILRYKRALRSIETAIFRKLQVDVPTIYFVKSTLFIQSTGALTREFEARALSKEMCLK